MRVTSNLTLVHTAYGIGIESGLVTKFHSYLQTVRRYCMWIRQTACYGAVRTVTDYLPNWSNSPMNQAVALWLGIIWCSSEYFRGNNEQLRAFCHDRNNSRPDVSLYIDIRSVFPFRIFWMKYSLNYWNYSLNFSSSLQKGLPHSPQKCEIFDIALEVFLEWHFICVFPFQYAFETIVVAPCPLVHT